MGQYNASKTTDDLWCEVARRRIFAMILHPDADNPMLTEKRRVRRRCLTIEP